MRNNQLESQWEERTSKEPLTISLTETSCTSENEECDIKYQIRTNTDMAIDPLQLELEHLDFPQQNDFIGQVSVKSEVNDSPNVTSFSHTEQATENEGLLFRIDLPNMMNFICGTCAAGFLNNQLKIHDRIHLKATNGKSAVKNIRRKRGKSGHSPNHNTTNVLKPPYLRPKKCEECGKVLSTSKTLRHHVMSVHRSEYKLRCTLCSFGCQTAPVLRRHTMSHSVNSEGFKCSKCDGLFKSQLSRPMHTLNCIAVVQQQ